MKNKPRKLGTSMCSMFNDHQFSVVVDIKNFSSNRDLDSIEGHRHDLSFFFSFLMTKMVNMGVF